MGFLVPRWGSMDALEIQPREIEQWLGSLKRLNPTKDKIRRIISVIYTSAEIRTCGAQRFVESGEVG
jgi:hypothetical protein